MLGFIKKFFDPTNATVKEAQPVVDEILALEPAVSKMSVKEMRDKVTKMKEDISELIKRVPEETRIPLKPMNFKDSELEIQIHHTLQEYIPELFAYLREINNRKFHKKHFPVQLLAAVILAQGNKLTELKTGEGKTQVFHLPAALYGLTKRGSHVITVNDYLARRDGEYAGHALSDLGITVGIITPQASYKFVPDDELKAVKGDEVDAERTKINASNLSDMHGINLVQCTKQEAYAQDIVYGTNNEFGFDYLRDNMVFNLQDRVQRELYYCIIDEADSILIDEARTPLIISAPAEASNQLYQKFARVVSGLEVEKHYVVDEKEHSASLTDEGTALVEKLLGVNNIWEDYRYAHHLDNALKAMALFKDNDHYIVKDGEILIVDEFTGRILPGRRYSEGLHQAIEAKEGVEIKQESKTLATITFQNFFKLYKIIGGGSGTILTEAEEFQKIYNLDSYVIPTNVKVIRKDLRDKVYKDRESKFKAASEEIIEAHKSGQPLLIGTTTIVDSEYLSLILDRKGIEHEVLNAKYHEKEASIIMKAGQKNSVTVATNMAGRGTDIPLGPGVVELGGLYVIGTERHEARRIDNQLRGRSGRQGDPGKSQFFVALDDEIMRIQGGDAVKRIMEITKLPPDIPIESPLISRAIENAQKKMEGYHFDMRKRVVDYDNVMNQQREIFYTKRLNVIKLTNKDDPSKEITQIIKANLHDKFENSIIRHLEVPDKPDYKGLASEILDLSQDDLINQIIINSKAFKTRNIKSISDLVKDKNNVNQNIISITDNLVDKKTDELKLDVKNIYKILSIQTMDELWTEHLESITDLREGIGLRGYAQRDPLVEYKNESYTLFENLMNSINDQVARNFLKINRIASPVLSEKTSTNQDEISDILTGSREISPKIKITPKHLVGRNDPCPCGSGLKYKKCGLINAPQHRPEYSTN